jgi:hypothetical protein
MYKRSDTQPCFRMHVLPGRSLLYYEAPLESSRSGLQNYMVPTRARGDISGVGYSSRLASRSALQSNNVLIRGSLQNNTQSLGLHHQIIHFIAIHVFFRLIHFW